jgi:ketopantoate reductase
VKPNGIVLTLQNGMGNREELTAYLSEHGSHQHVVQGVTEAGSMLISYQTVKHTGHGTTFLPAGYPDIDHFATVLQQVQ